RLYARHFSKRKSLLICFFDKCRQHAKTGCTDEYGYGSLHFIHRCKLRQKEGYTLGDTAHDISHEIISVSKVNHKCGKVMFVNQDVSSIDLGRRQEKQ